MLTLHGGHQTAGPDTDTQELVARHMRWMIKARRADTTINTRRGHIVRFVAWLDDQGRTVFDADPALLERWQEHLSLGKGVSAVSERNTISHVRMFFQWAVREELLTRDPTVRLILPRPKRRAPRPIPEAVLELAVDSADADVRMRVVLLLAACAGLRAVEICRLSWSDIDLDGEMYVNGKGGHERTVWLAEEGSPLVAALKAMPGPHRGPVIKRRDGRPGHMRANTLSKEGNAYLHELGIASTLHKLRARFATVGHSETKDAVSTARLLGHVNLNNFLIYADAGAQDRRAVIAAVTKIGGARHGQARQPDEEFSPDDAA